MASLLSSKSGTIFLWLILATLVSCTTTPKPVHPGKSFANHSIPNFNYTLISEGRAKITRNKKTESLSLIAEINSDSFRIDLFDPLYSAVMSIYADTKKLTLINYNDLLVENYKNTPTNQKKIFGFPLDVRDARLFFLGRVVDGEYPNWEFKTNDSGFLDQAKHEEKELVVKFSSYISQDGILYPKKTSITNQGSTSKILFISTERNLFVKRVIAFPEVSKDFQFIDYP